MPIRNLPVRYPELGRIRLGEKEEMAGGKSRPKKLETFRFTSHDETVIGEIANLYGGTPGKWEGAPEGEQYEVVTETATLPVLIPPRDALSLWYERWGTGGCQRRCDGDVCLVPGQKADAEGKPLLDSKGKPEMGLIDRPCWCKENGLTPNDNEAVRKGACALNLRLSVVLHTVQGLGTFMLCTGSIYAAMELPGQVQLLERLSEGAQLIPADLCIEQRREKKSYEQFPREFPVPVLRVRQSLQQLAAAASGTGELASGAGVAGALNAGTVERTSSRPSTIAHFPPHVQAVVMVCGEAKLTDDQRHALCYAVSDKRTSSSKDLNIGEAARALAALDDGSWHTLVSAPDEPVQQKIIDATAKVTPATKKKATPPSASPPPPRVGKPVANPDTIDPVYRDDLKAALEKLSNPQRTAVWTEAKKRIGQNLDSPQFTTAHGDILSDIIGEVTGSTKAQAS